jgi:XisH protein
MPAIDQCQPQIIRAFDKAGWDVSRKPVTLQIERDPLRYVYVDLRLKNRNNRQTIIVVEIKCFADPNEFLGDFYTAVGQYAIYRSALDMNDDRSPLYLAVSLEAYNMQFHREIVQRTLDAVHVSVVVIDLEREEIVQWTD